MGLVVDQQRLASLPLIHGDPYKIMGLATGLTHTGDQRLDRPFEPTHVIGYAMDGTRGNRSDLLIDGLPSTATANANEVIATYVPPSDLVQEFKVQTATFDSQFGNTEGGVTSMVIKSGTNRLSGSAYYFAEPSSWGANDFFGKARGQAKVESNSNRPGVTIGGPIFRDKTFYMFGYERITDKRPRFDLTGDPWVPTEALRNGDFSAYSPFITIYDPLTRAPSGTAGQFVGQPFANNIIPANRINPIAKMVLEYYSLPKNSGLNGATGPAGNIFDATLAERTKAYNTVTGKVDHKISAHNKMFVRGSWYERNSHYNDYLASAASGTLFQFISYQAVVDDVHVFNPTTVLNVRYGYNRFDRNSDMEKPEAIGFDLTKLGFPAQYNTLIPEIDRRFPRLDFTGGMVPVAYGNDFRPVASHTLAATLNKSAGAHALKGGRGDEDLRRTQPAHRQRPGRPVRLYQHLHPAEQRQRHGLSGPAGLRVVPPRHALHHVDLASPGLRRAVHHVGALRAGRLAGQQQADAEPRPALRGRDRADREPEPQRLRLRFRLHAADPDDRPGELRGAQRSRAQGPRSAVEREGRSAVRGYRRRERALLDAEEHLPAAVRVGLPVDAQDRHPRRRRAVRRLPRRAARRRDPVGLLSNDHRRHHDQRLSGRRSRSSGTTRSSPRRSSSRSATRQASRRSLGRGSPSSTRIRKCRSSFAGRWASSASCRAA